MTVCVTAGIRGASQSAAASAAAPILFRVFKFINLRKGWGNLSGDAFLKHAGKKIASADMEASHHLASYRIKEKGKR
jgi:hypothetical protein